MDRRFVPAPRLAKPAAQGHVHGTPDLFIKQHVAREAADALVRADCRLPEAVRPRHFQDFAEEILSFGRIKPDDLPAGHCEPDVLYLLTHVDARIGEPDVSLDALFNGRREYLARRHVVPAV